MFSRRSTAGTVAGESSNEVVKIAQASSKEVSSPVEAPPLYIEDGYSSLNAASGIDSGRFAVTTKTDSLSSGFPFHEKLYEFGVTNEEWFLFSNEIVNASKTNFGNDFGAWSTAIAVGTVSCAGLLVFGPVAGYYAGRPLHRKAVAKKVREELMHDGRIRSILSHWNEGVFKQKGFKAWLELPRMSGEDLKADKSDKNIKKSERKKEARRFKILIIPNYSADASPQNGVQVLLLNSAPGELHPGDIQSSPVSDAASPVQEKKPQDYFSSCKATSPSTPAPQESLPSSPTEKTTHQSMPAELDSATVR